MVSVTNQNQDNSGASSSNPNQETGGVYSILIHT